MITVRVSPCHNAQAFGTALRLPLSLARACWPSLTVWSRRLNAVHSLRTKLEDGNLVFHVHPMSCDVEPTSRFAAVMSWFLSAGINICGANRLSHLWFLYTVCRLLSIDYSLYDRTIGRMSGARDKVLIAAFAVALRRARSAAGLTQEQVAVKANIDRTFVAFLETSKRQPSLSVICALAYAVGQTPSALVSNTCEIAALSVADRG